jgi:hypothetical protein
MKRASVCIVGNGPSAGNNKNGSFIDECNTVIRMGNFTTVGYEEFVGSKLDVYVSRWKKLEANFDKVQDADVWIAYPRPPHNWCSHYSKECSTDRNNRAIKNLQVTYIPEDIQILYKRIYHPYNNILAKQSDRECKFNIPDTGSVAIDMACHIFPDADIYVTGFDGYFLNTSYYFDKNRKMYRDFVNSSPILQQYIRFKKLKAAKRINVL